MGYFVQNKKGKIVNVMMIQNVVIDKLNPTNIVWKMKNGQSFADEYNSDTEATEAYTKLQEALMESGGGNEDELEAEIHSLRIQVNNLTTEVTEKTNTINSLNSQVASLQSSITTLQTQYESALNSSIEKETTIEEAKVSADNIIGEEIWLDE